MNCPTCDEAHGRFQCAVTRRCIDSVFRCDGDIHCSVPDTADDSDEFNCSECTNLLCGLFFCSNRVPYLTCTHKDPRTDALTHLSDGFMDEEG